MQSSTRESNAGDEMESLLLINWNYHRLQLKRDIKISAQDKKIKKGKKAERERKNFTDDNFHRKLTFAFVPLAE